MKANGMQLIGQVSALAAALRASPARAAAILLAVAAAVFGAEQIDLLRRDGLWLDEYYSLWASDPHAPFRAVLTGRILPDTNPPLYYLLLMAARHALPTPRAAFEILNLIALALAAWFVGRSALRAGFATTGALALGLFLLSGAAVDYFPEGRVYFASMCVALAIAWRAALAVDSRAPKDEWPLSFTILGALAAMTHVYTAIFAASIAAALCLEALWRRRRDLFYRGLLLGSTATVLLGLWAASSLKHASNVAWLTLSAASLRAAAWYVRQLALGPNAVLILVAAFLALSCFRRELWAQARLFAVTGAFFIALPILASLHTPIIYGRYWLIGAPLLDVFAAFALRAHALALARGGDKRAAYAGIAAGSACFLIVSVFGYVTARQFTETKPFWRGAPLVRTLSSSCAPGSVRVWEWSTLYPLAAGAPEARFTYVAPATAPIRAGAVSCPVLGWAEHVYRGEPFMSDANDAQLMDMLKITAAPADGVRVVRYPTGFVVLRKDAAPHVE